MFILQLLFSIKHTDLWNIWILLTIGSNSIHHYLSANNSFPLAATFILHGPKYPVIITNCVLSEHF